ncbi:MAG: hypothetical protein H7Y00_00830 [Fimbriimonadaceae bacterium]|nr:hypothetical protein [Chitinophagales bacterium]
MTHTHQFNNMVANVVTKVAVSFPVQIIETISFYSHKHLIATCFWNEENDQVHSIKAGPLHISPDFVLLENITCLQPTDICITGIDEDDQPFSLHLSLDFLNNKFAA